MQALPGTGSGSGSASACNPGTPANVPATPYYDPARPYLGPEPLPQTPPVGPLLEGYKRFGNYTEAGFVAKFHPGTNYIYPPDNGFLFIGDHSTAHPETLSVGTRVDRFGGPMGKYLAPVGVVYSERALPPSNLNSYGGTPQSDYHVYCVQQAFRVDAGPAAPWFGQPGLGNQYVLNPSYVPGPEYAGPDPGMLNIQWMIDNGYLVEEIPH
ncbi:TNT domain-containing protein [Nocardia arizonensis]|uniref:TNT domain-containing protein n=1 Tax=Nocardia arizonensis TaxID=1141647 RepID=UPI001951D99E|nr:TNT domain-containing protein [Nocardia arizonensis]